MQLHLPHMYSLHLNMFEQVTLSHVTSGSSTCSNLQLCLCPQSRQDTPEQAASMLALQVVNGGFAANTINTNSRLWAGKSCE